MSTNVMVLQRKKNRKQGREGKKGKGGKKKEGRKRGGGRKRVENRRKEVIKEYLATRCLNQMEIICKF